MARILVGVDGSDASRRALQWAVAEAELRDTSVDVMHAYKSEYFYYVDVPSAVVMPRLEVESAARVAVERILSQVVNPTEIEIDVDYVNSGNPAKELVDRSVDYELLVLGSRGLGGLGGLLLGSVTQKVAQHAQCPVTIIPPIDKG